MAYSTTNPPIKQNAGPLTSGPNRSETGNGGGNFWLYNSTDVIATVEGANYFTNAQALGMLPSDLIYVVDSTSPHAYLTTLATVTATGGTTSGTHVTLQ